MIAPVEAMVAAYRSGMSVIEVSQQFGVGQGKTRRIIRAAGAMRPPGPTALFTSLGQFRQYDRLRRCVGVEVARREMEL